MRQEQVSFYSGGDRVVATLRLPEESSKDPVPAVVQGPGWLGLRDAKLYIRYHEALTAAGFAVMIIDYRGFGDSGGNSEVLSPSNQLEDLVNAVTYLTVRSDIDADRIGVFGSGGTGGGNAIMLAAADSRVRCVVSQVPVADGEDWLRRMRSEEEWHAFLDRLAKDREQRVLTGAGEMVHPREEIMVPTLERRSSDVKKDVDGRVPTSVELRSAEGIIAYKPIEVVANISPRPVLLIAVENDAVTPTDHAVALYERAGGPKRLIMQRNTTHYAAYEQYADVVVPEIVKWFEQNLTDGSVVIVSDDETSR
jgi:uncharacterized protein